MYPFLLIRLSFFNLEKIFLLLKIKRCEIVVFFKLSAWKLLTAQQFLDRSFVACILMVLL